MRSREVANVMWSLGRLVHISIGGSETTGELVPALLAHATPLLPSCNSQELANLAWACAKLSHLDEAFLSAFEAAATESLTRHRQGWGAGGGGGPGRIVAGDDGGGVGLPQQRIAKPEWNSQELSNVAWAMGTLGRWGRVLVIKYVYRSGS